MNSVDKDYQDAYEFNVSICQ